MNKVSSMKRGSCKKNKGIFLVEFTCALLFLAAFLLFISELIIWQTVQGHIHNLSYSGVTLIKERSRLYQQELQITQRQATELFTQLSQVLERSYPAYSADDLGFRLDQFKVNNIDTSQPHHLSFSDGLNCSDDDDDIPLRKITQSLGSQKVTLYQVTVCYRVRPHKYWFGNDGLVFQSRSIMPER